MSAFRNVLKMARDEGVVDDVIDTPRAKQKDNPRPFFRFHPVCSEADDAYQKLLTAAREMATEGVAVRGIAVTEELRDIILFLAHSFVRPLATELYALKHSDITVSDKPRGLVLVVRDGKTGYRAVNTMPTAATVYERIRKRHPDAAPDDYLFLPQYRNRTTAAQIIQRQFAELLKRAGLDRDVSHREEARTLFPAPHGDLHAARQFPRQGQHLHAREERGYVRRSDRALLCQAPANDTGAMG